MSLFTHANGGIESNYPRSFLPRPPAAAYLARSLVAALHPRALAGRWAGVRRGDARVEGEGGGTPFPPPRRLPRLPFPGPRRRPAAAGEIRTPRPLPPPALRAIALRRCHPCISFFCGVDRWTVVGAGGVGISRKVGSWRPKNRFFISPRHELRALRVTQRRSCFFGDQ